MILVTGGTGVVGSAIVAELHKQGQSVAVLGRDAAKIERAFGGSVEARQGDVTRPETLARAMNGIDIVIDAVQFPTSPIEVPRRGWTFENVDYRGTVNQVDAAKAAGVKRYAYVSAIGADLNGPKHWFRFKAMAEQHLQQSGPEWTIVRPTWIYGPRDHSLNRLLGFTNFLPFLPFFGDGKQDMQPVFIEDVGRIVAQAALAPQAANQLFELGGPEVMSMNQVMQTGLEVMGRKRFILHQPLAVGKLIGTLASLQPFITPPLSADAVDFISRPAVADNANLMKLLKPELTPLRRGLETYLKR
jgi:NADH dehydrogenase